MVRSSKPPALFLNFLICKPPVRQTSSFGHFNVGQCGPLDNLPTKFWPKQLEPAEPKRRQLGGEETQLEAVASLPQFATAGCVHLKAGLHLLERQISFVTAQIRLFV
jgi:hypothetical protein